MSCVTPGRGVLCAASFLWSQPNAFPLAGLTWATCLLVCSLANMGWYEGPLLKMSLVSHYPKR